MRLHVEVTKEDAQSLLIGLVLFELLLVGIYLWLQLFLHHPMRIFDLDGEANLPSWFSSVQLFIIGQIFFLKSCQNDAEIQPSPLFLRLVCFGFIFLSLDEAAYIHETLNRILILSSSMPHFKGEHGAWIFLYTFGGIGILLGSFKGILAMWTRYCRESAIMTLGITIALSGGVILEIISYQFLRSGSTPLAYIIEVAFEEFFEMSGGSVVLYGASRLLFRKNNAEC